MGHEFLDRYSRLDSPLHRIGPCTKLMGALLLIAAAVATPIRYWPVHASIALAVATAYAIARIPWRYAAARLLVFLPFVLLLSLSAPFSRALTPGEGIRSAEGWYVMAAVLVYAMLSFAIMMLLVNTTPFNQLLVALGRLRVPKIFVATLAFMYRYVFVLLDELARMRRARAARRFADRRWSDWKVSAQMIGVLLVRSFERAERVYGAMRARGWDGQAGSLEE